MARAGGRPAGARARRGGGRRRAGAAQLGARRASAGCDAERDGVRRGAAPGPPQDRGEQGDEERGPRPSARSSPGRERRQRRRGACARRRGRSDSCRPSCAAADRRGAGPTAGTSAGEEQQAAGEHDRGDERQPGTGRHVAAGPRVGGEGAGDDHGRRREGAREGVRRTRLHHPRLHDHGHIVPDRASGRGRGSSGWTYQPCERSVRR